MIARALLGASRTWIARGYRPPARARVEPRWRVAADIDLGGAIGALCPSYVGPGNRGGQRATVAHILEQLAAVVEAPVCLLVGMQHTAGDRAEAGERIDHLAGDARAAGVAFAGFTMEASGKVRSVNVAIELAASRGAAGLLLLDDDIALERDCLVHLVRAFLARGGRGAVGAEKIGLARGRTSVLLRWLKRHIRPACNYPHACCMLLAPDLLAPGIPDRYVCDDGFICFTLLRPAADDPFQDLVLVPGARCRHVIGGPPVQSARRIRRLLLDHHIYLADFPLDVSAAYLRRSLFPGFWPIGAPASESAGSTRASARALRWVLQAAYFAVFCAVGLELALRGLTGRPLREVRWAGFTDRARPLSAPAGG